ncbi:hypothetical protein VUR80DRAFT_1723 [Thermomyces stellatus]
MQASVPENTRALLDSNSWVPAFARRFREGEATAEQRLGLQPNSHAGGVTLAAMAGELGMPGAEEDSWPPSDVPKPFRPSVANSPMNLDDLERRKWPKGTSLRLSLTEGALLLIGPRRSKVSSRRLSDRDWARHFRVGFQAP